MNRPQPKAIFFRIKDNAAKIRYICKQVQEAMQKEKKILIHVPNEEAAKYVDTLLWTTPEESFLPHVVSYAPTNEWIVITHLEQNLNQAQFLFNLRPCIASFAHQIEEIYEFYEEFHSEKAQLAQKKIKEYETFQFNVEFRG